MQSYCIKYTLIVQSHAFTDCCIIVFGKYVYYISTIFILVHEHLSIIIDLHIHISYLGIEDSPTIQQLQEVMRIEHIEIATKWYELGLELVDSNKALKVIEADYRNVNTCCRTMFEKWLEKTPNASWNQLVTALDNIEMNTAADAVRKLFKSGMYKHL